jgi:hypothetical protein
LQSELSQHLALIRIQIGAFNHLVRDLACVFGPARAKDGINASWILRIGWETPPQLERNFDFGGIGMRNFYDTQSAARVGNVYRAPVCDARNRQAGKAPERFGEIECRAEQMRGFGQKALPLSITK